MAAVRETLIDDLERVVANKDIGDRAVMLRRVTNLFLVSSGSLSQEQVALFDDVMVRLLEEIESSARAAFGHLIARVGDAPPTVVRRLALDDAIEVAGEILRYSDQLDEQTLVEGAQTKSQAHLLAISRRTTLAPPVTDVLAERGDRQVALAVAENPGAAFSDFGYSTLVQRSLHDEDLAACVWMRPEIPRQHLLKLFADASETVKLKLSGKDPHKADFILEIVAQASQQIQSKARDRSASYGAARDRVRGLHAAGALDEAHLAEFARAGEFDEATVALSLLCDLPIASIERAFTDERSEQIVVIAKAVGLSWETVKAMLQLQAKAHHGLTPKLERSFETFTRLHAETAKKALRFFRLREQAAKPPGKG
jgi:uncharacterized protein (DUF2336 family)